MSSHHPKSFFIELKDTVKKIDQDINEVKKKIQEPTGSEILSSVKICDIRDEIVVLAKEAPTLKQMLEPKLAHTDNFIQQFKDLISETEVAVLKHETYLEKFGYKPMEKAATQDSEHEEKEKYCSPVKESSVNGNGTTTPNLLLYGLVSRNPRMLDLNLRKSSIESLIPPQNVEISEAYLDQEKIKESTPTLQIEVSDRNEKEASTNSYLPYVLSSPRTPTLEL